MVTPAGSCFWIWATLAPTSRTTSRLFDPRSIITMPVTASPLPSRVITPYRSAGATRTSATWRTSTGVSPLPFLRTTSAISCWSRSRPWPRTVYASSRRST
ncbi:MAG: hypothetical protein QM820_41155 [Minicystis sp.]